MAPLNPYDAPQVIEPTAEGDRKNAARQSRSVGCLYFAAAATCAILSAYLLVVDSVLRSSRPVVNPWPFTFAAIALAIISLVLALKGVWRLARQ